MPIALIPRPGSELKATEELALNAVEGSKGALVRLAPIRVRARVFVFVRSSRSRFHGHDHEDSALRLRLF